MELLLRRLASDGPKRNTPTGALFWRVGPPSYWSRQLGHRQRFRFRQLGAFSCLGSFHGTQVMRCLKARNHNDALSPSFGISDRAEV
jgi:hypothetical protein